MSSRQNDTKSTTDPAVAGGANAHAGVDDASAKSAAASPASADPAPAGAAPSGDGSAHQATSERLKAMSPLRRWVTTGLAGCLLLAGGYYLVPATLLVLNTVSTDDAYINGHVTIVAARVSGQVTKVLVDDNNRVRKGDVLVELDREPYQIQVDARTAALETAKANLSAAEDEMRGSIGQARAARYRLEHAMEDVRNQVALLKSNVAEWKAEQANLTLAERDYARGESLVGDGAISKQQFDQYRATLDVARNRSKSAEERVQQTRASLGLSPNSEDPLEVPDDLDQTFSTVRQALSDLMVAAAPLGVVPSTYTGSPKEVIADFYKRHPEGNLDRIYEQLLRDAAPIKQAQARMHQAAADLAQAELELRYCHVLAEIDGVVTRRNVNPGNNVQAGQSLMALRSLTEIWVDANFKETQIAELRIGQPVDVYVDMYGGRRRFEGRISGFTMGTGSTLALLPPQNATGNFVKVVQRLPVRIDLEDYNPEKETLFIGLSVIPYVHFKAKPTGPNAGQRLQETLTPENDPALRGKE